MALEKGHIELSNGSWPDEHPGKMEMAVQETQDIDRNSGRLHFGRRQIVSIASLCILWAGSQLPLYFMGATLQYTAVDLGGTALSQASWIPVSNILAVAAVCPWSGYLGDILGRRYVTLLGAGTIIVGVIIVATAQSFGQAIAGMAIAGSGAGIGELVALSGVAELVPVRKRGIFVALTVAFLFPTAPYALYAQLLSTRTAQGWRWGQWIPLMYNGVAFIGILVCYFPERTQDIKRPPIMEALRKIDYVGGFMSIAGIALFLVALQSGGYTHPWTDAYVLAPLTIGLMLIIGFCIYEWKFAEHPMIPKELFQGQKVVAMVFLICFVAGMNLYSLLNFFPLSFQTLYDDSTDPVQVGLKGLGYGTSGIVGAVVFDILLSALIKYNKQLVLGSCVIMTSFIGALTAVTPHNPKLNVALGTIATFGTSGLTFGAGTVAMTACPDSLIGTTVALSLSVRLIGGSVGYTIYYNIFTEKFNSRLPNVAEAAVRAGLPQAEAGAFVKAIVASPEAARSFQGATSQVLSAATAALQESYAYGFRYVWLTSIPFGVIAVITCLFLPSNQKFLTERIAAGIKG